MLFGIQIREMQGSQNPSNKGVIVPHGSNAEKYSRASPYGHLSNTDSSLGPGKMPIHPL